MKKRKIATTVSSTINPAASRTITPTVSLSSGPIESLQLAPAKPPHVAPTVPLDDNVIAHRAYAIWQAEGEPIGRDFDHWLRAEAELRASATTATTETVVSAGQAQVATSLHGSD